MPEKPDKPEWGIRVDPADPEYRPLLNAAGRIDKLLTVAHSRDDQFLRSTLDLLLGAIYSFILAKHSDYAHRTGKVESDKPRTRSRDVESGWIRLDGRWIAGFHFNGAILRIAAVYHRALKIALDVPTSRAYVDKLQPQACTRYPSWTDANAGVIHTEVNAIKHEAGGLSDARTATPDHVVQAIDEILKLLEAWAASAKSAHD